jgi:hypothetical protein
MTYNEKAVQKAIDNDKRIGRREAQAIHRLLKGRHERHERADNDAAVVQAQEEAYEDNEARRIGLI